MYEPIDRNAEYDWNLHNNSCLFRCYRFCFANFVRMLVYSNFKQPNK